MMLTIFLIGTFCAYGFETVKLKRIISQGDERQAVIVTPAGEELTVGEGDSLPGCAGKVNKINARSIVIKEPASGGGNIYYEVALPAGNPGTVRVD
jgi:Tfp pilus assembly protein PilP